MRTTINDKLNSIRDFENQMARVSELMKGITPDVAEAFRSLAHSLEVGLNIKQNKSL